MNVRQTLIMLLTSLLTVAAAVAIFLFRAPYKTEASCTCAYKGQDYTVGATAQNGCTGKSVQTCTDGGSYGCYWSPCAPPA